MTTTITLAAGDASASIATRGAQPCVWNIRGRNLLFDADPRWWPWHAPILFPVVGESAQGRIRIGDTFFPMPRHGFARTCIFDVAEALPDRVRLRLSDDVESRRHYPFAFVFEVAIVLAPQSLALTFTVENRDEVEMPYSAGFHPALTWPFCGGEQTDYAIRFEQIENPEIPTLTQKGLLRDEGRRVVLQGHRLALAPDLFDRDALVFRDLRSRHVSFEGPHGRIDVSFENFGDLGIWTKPGAPYLCIEPWAGTADRDGFTGELRQRPGIRHLAPRAKAQHRVTLALAGIA